MPLLAIIFGSLLIALGLIGYLLAGVGGNANYASWTALIPAVPGIVILLCGIASTLKPAWNKIFMHIAVLFALLGALAPLGRIPASLRAEQPNYIALFSLFGMLALCAAFVVLGVRSFIAARRNRTQISTD